METGTINPLFDTLSRQPQSAAASGEESEVPVALRDQVKALNSEVQAFEKEIQDVVVDTLQSARDIGILVENNSRLNVFTALTEGDTVDNFKFRVHRDGAAKLGFLTNRPDQAEEAAQGEEDAPPAIRVQVMTRNGRLLADSGADDGSDLKANFMLLELGGLHLEAAEYVVRVERAEDVPARELVNYSFQLTMGAFNNDYDTIEQPPPAGTNVAEAFPLPADIQGMADALVAGSSYIASLPPIGTPATDKLMGALLSDIA